MSEKEIYDENAKEDDLFEKHLISEYILAFDDPEDYERLVRTRK